MGCATGLVKTIVFIFNFLFVVSTLLMFTPINPQWIVLLSSKVFVLVISALAMNFLIKKYKITVNCDLGPNK